MQIPNTNLIKTEGKARQLAIDWQTWQNNQDLSYMEIMEWQICFKELANKFNLSEEFKENGII